MIFYIIGFLIVAGFGLVILKIRNRILLNIEQAEKSGLVRNANINDNESVIKESIFSDNYDDGIYIDAQGRYNPIPNSPLYNPLHND